MSSDMALRFSGLLKVMTPTPSATVCRILPSAKDLSVAFGTFSIVAAFGDWSLVHQGLKHCLGVSAMAARSPPVVGEGYRIWRIEKAGTHHPGLKSEERPLHQSVFQPGG